jgi:hypothetical protein
MAEINIRDEARAIYDAAAALEQSPMRARLSGLIALEGRFGIQFSSRQIDRMQSADDVIEGVYRAHVTDRL